jgi:hypothetical protein
VNEAALYTAGMSRTIRMLLFVVLGSIVGFWLRRFGYLIHHPSELADFLCGVQYRLAYGPDPREDPIYGLAGSVTGALLGCGYEMFLRRREGRAK